MIQHLPLAHRPTGPDTNRRNHLSSYSFHSYVEVLLTRL